MLDAGLPEFIRYPAMEMPTVTIKGEAYIGTLRIPTLDLELPVISQWSYPGLKLAPCRYWGSAYQENLIIAAHNYKAHFGRIKSLEIGAPVAFTDVDGNHFHYVVEEIETLSATAREEMKAGGWPLTLFTCTPGGQSQLLYAAGLPPARHTRNKVSGRQCSPEKSRVVSECRAQQRSQFCPLAYSCSQGEKACLRRCFLSSHKTAFLPDFTGLGQRPGAGGFWMLPAMAGRFVQPPVHPETVTRH